VLETCFSSAWMRVRGAFAFFFNTGGHRQVRSSLVQGVEDLPPGLLLGGTDGLGVLEQTCFVQRPCVQVRRPETMAICRLPVSFANQDAARTLYKMQNMRPSRSSATGCHFSHKEKRDSPVFFAVHVLSDGGWSWWNGGLPEGWMEIEISISSSRDFCNEVCFLQASPDP